MDIKRVQQRLLEMAKNIVEVLEKNDIPYMIGYGTLLGAVRHKRFIPWDDDFDFFLFDDTYDNAIEHLRAELPESMFVEDEKSEMLYFHMWAHVKDKKTRAICSHYLQDNAYAHHGLSIDLYRTKKILLKDLRFYLDSENRKYLQKRKDKDLISEDEYDKKLNRYAGNAPADNEKVSDAEIYTQLVYPWKKFYADDVFPLKRYKFEELYFWGPSNASNVLKELYGDYMQLPPLSERKPHFLEVSFLD